MNSTEDAESAQLSTTSTPNTFNDSQLSYEIRHLTLQFELMKTGCLPVVVFGIVGNLASLWIWQAQGNFNPTTFLHKYLAIADLGFLLGDLVLLIQRNHFWDLSWTALPGHLGRLFQVMSVHVTLAVAVFRFLAVYRPIHASLMLPRCRVVALCVAIFAWSVVAEIVRIAAMFCILLYPAVLPGGAGGVSPLCARIMPAFDTLYRYHRNEVVTYLVPLVLMLLFNVAIMWKIRHRDVTNAMTKQQRAPAQRASRRLTLCVVVITSTSLVSYPMTFVMRWAVLGNATADVVGACAFVAVLLTQVNSSVNVVYYWAFVSEFRRLTALRFRTLCPGLCPRVSGRSPAQSHLTLSAELSSTQIVELSLQGN